MRPQAVGEVKEKFMRAMVALHLKMQSIFASRNEQERRKLIEDFKQSYGIVEQGLDSLSEILPQ